jgi:uncharacterized membrane protein YfcA
LLDPHLDLGVGHSVSFTLLALAGLFVGYIAGMFGIGGGFLLTPLLIFVFGVPAPIAVGSALSQKCGTSIASFLKYRHLKRGEPRIDLIMMGGSLIGVDAGTRLLARLSARRAWHANGHSVPLVNLVLDVLFIVLLVAVSAYVFHDVWKARGAAPRGDKTIPGPLARIRIPPYIDLPRVQLERVSVPVLAYIGLLLGVLSGVMGIGGGVVFMPILLYGYGLSARNAAGTGVLLLAVTVAFGTFEQALHGFVSLKLALAILAGSSIGSQLGALTTHVLPNRTLRLLFGVLVAATTVMIGVDLVRLVSK